MYLLFKKVPQISDSDCLNGWFTNPDESHAVWNITMKYIKIKVNLIANKSINNVYKRELGLWMHCYLNIKCFCAQYFSEE